MKKSDFFTLSEKSIFDTFRAMQKSQKKEFLNAKFLFKKIYFSAKKMHKKNVKKYKKLSFKLKKNITKF